MRYLALFLLVPGALVAGQARYARLGEFEGQVEVQLQAADPWMPAERNLPLPEAAWIRTGPASRVEIELDDGSVWRLGPDSQGELSDYSQLSTGQRITALSLDRGLAYFTGQPRDKDALTLTVPGAQVIYFRRARVRLEAADTWSRISVLEGAARFSSPAAEIDITQGATTRVDPDKPDRFFLNREVLAMELDRWSSDRDKAMAANTSNTHVVERYGLVDLDNAGEWISTDAYGTVWKPKTPEGWVPYQKGRWRWYDALGYCWVSDDTWGWLPYHYGRWARSGELGWVWAPNLSQVFKPGDVYWLRGAKLVGWGPLAPGEHWTVVEQPDQFLNAHTTYAAFQLDARLLDPAGFTERPKEPLAVAAFAPALPSPTFPSSRLDATRPVLRAGSTRITPVIRGVTYQDAVDFVPPPPAQRTAVGTAPQPVIVINQPAPDPEQVVVPVPVPYPVIAGIFSVPAPKEPASKQPAPKRNTAAAAPPVSTVAKSSPQQPPRPRKRFHDRLEGEMYDRVLNEQGAPAKELIDLDAWTQRYPDSDFADERAVFYMRAYNLTGHPDKVVDLGAKLMTRELTSIFTEPAQVLSVLYLTTSSAEQLPNPDRIQRTVFRYASQQLLNYIPIFFEPAKRPASLSETDWQSARQYMENVARKVLAMERH